MYVNIAVLKETHPHERPAALTNAFGCDQTGRARQKLHMQTGAIKLADAAFIRVRHPTWGTVPAERSMIGATSLTNAVGSRSQSTCQSPFFKIRNR
jgi:hypothetical protein